MIKKRLLAGLLAVTLIWGCTGSAATVNAATDDTAAYQLQESTDGKVIVNADGMAVLEENAGDVTDIDVADDVKMAKADKNGFVIEKGVLKKYTGSGGDITIPDGVKSIEKYAFWYSFSVTSVTIPKSLESMDGNVFLNCTKLKEIKVSKNNQYFSSENGILYDKKKKVLLQCPRVMEGDIIIPETVVKIGDEAFFNCHYLTSISIPESVTSIGKTAFNFCNRLLNVTIPKNVTSIGEGAFAGCQNMTEIKVSEDNKYFTSENGILYDKKKKVLIQCPEAKSGEIKIPKSVTDIGGLAFYYCQNLTSIIIPENVTNIGRLAFLSCEGLTSVTIPKGVASIGEDIFEGCTGLTEIKVSENNRYFTSENGVLYDKKKKMLIQCPGAKEGEFIIPESVTDIESRAFESCEKLISVTIPKGVTQIEEYTFAWCSSLSNVTIPKGVTSIGHAAFYSCTSLKNITIPKTVTSIDQSAFDTSVDLTIFCYKDSAAEKYAKTYKFKYQYLTDDSDSSTDTENDQKLPAVGKTVTSGKDSYKVTKQGTAVAFVKTKSKSKTITIPATVKVGNTTYKVTSIAANALKGNKKLTKVTIGKNVTSIGKGAFQNCTALTKITVPDKVTSIGDLAFSGCKKMTTVTLGKGLKKIGKETFKGNSKLSSITIKSTALKSVGKDALKGIQSNAKIKVPAKKLSAYKKLLKNKGQGKKVKITK